MVDYPENRVRLQKHSDLSFIQDEFIRVGAVLRPEPGMGATVALVFPASDAERKGVQVGHRVASIDSQSVDGLGVEQLDLLLRGTVGDARLIGFREPPVAISVDVEDILETDQ